MSETKPEFIEQQFTIDMVRCDARNRHMKTEINGNWLNLKFSYPNHIQTLQQKTIYFMKNLKLDVVNGEFVIKPKRNYLDVTKDICGR